MIASKLKAEEKHFQPSEKIDQVSNLKVMWVQTIFSNLGEWGSKKILVQS